jgi:hypothetical protein
MKAIETTARFNEKGEIIVDKLPDLKNKKVRLLILFEEESENAFYNLSPRAYPKLTQLMNRIMTCH